MEVFYGILDSSISMACQINRLYCTHGQHIVTDLLSGGPKILSGVIPSGYEIDDDIKLPPSPVCTDRSSIYFE